MEDMEKEVSIKERFEQLEELNAVRFVVSGENFDQAREVANALADELKNMVKIVSLARRFSTKLAQIPELTEALSQYEGVPETELGTDKELPQYGIETSCEYMNVEEAWGSDTVSSSRKMMFKQHLESILPAKEPRDHEVNVSTPEGAMARIFRTILVDLNMTAAKWGPALQKYLTLKQESEDGFITLEMANDILSSPKMEWKDVFLFLKGLEREDLLLRLVVAQTFYGAERERG